jgi:hypothetical protein
VYGESAAQSELPETKTAKTTSGRSVFDFMRASLADEGPARQEKP